MQLASSFGMCGSPSNNFQRLSGARLLKVLFSSRSYFGPIGRVTGPFAETLDVLLTEDVFVHNLLHADVV